jgi:hypothetical protein
MWHEIETTDFTFFGTNGKARVQDMAARKADFVLFVRGGKKHMISRTSASSERPG